MPMRDRSRRAGLTGSINLRSGSHLIASLVLAVGGMAIGGLALAEPPDPQTPAIVLTTTEGDPDAGDGGGDTGDAGNEAGGNTVPDAGDPADGDNADDQTGSDPPVDSPENGDDGSNSPPGNEDNANEPDNTDSDGDGSVSYTHLTLPTILRV